LALGEKYNVERFSLKIFHWNEENDGNNEEGCKEQIIFLSI
jgi:hypothetical protein